MYYIKIRLTDAEVSIYRCVSGGSSEVFSISVGDVLTSLRVSKALGETEIDDVDVVLLLPNANEEIVWLNISV